MDVDADLDEDEDLDAGPARPRWQPRRRSRPPAHGAARTVFAVLAWFVLTALALVALGRLVHLDDAIGWPYPALNALTPLLYLPVYAVLLVGFALRRNALMVAVVPLIGLHLFWTVPEVWPATGGRDAPAGAVPVRVLASNLLYHNADAGRLGAQIKADQPDVVVLVEASPLALGAVGRSGALAGYPHHVELPKPGAFGFAVYSRFPLSDWSVREVGGQPLSRVTVTLDGGRKVLLYPVHTISPTTAANVRAWRSQLKALTDEVRAAKLPVILAGDFNATRDHRPLRRLLDAGVRDAHDVAGAGWSPTWSTESLLPPVLRIDHVLASPAFVVTGYHRGDRIGSDHLPVIVDLALRTP
ncbi:endonuclease/exonuclease/phosphatase family protein [Frankia sp. CNm7]|uniref:Endonuclease/exonuclease/phosphatase family protein n=1 Tax=Frankia nepalensis TaxID=1836974 RepID=A0A937RME1_9ACTN|nr:endonuclease/exonuclease/phosphatase family protein [Frankia nepalensis]MBL7513975.1 endonuclease/exonuclease/phosphatase family protein [Frankia nepalensis]MBL7517699.1 endonuclease/exonuclease/phosphatase family protein [Frankia nepalensis]MBL7628556.1 endonuclease/exonuclease/phosphatase family protein [Frankia nepalensis]